MLDNVEDSFYRIELWGILREGHSLDASDSKESSYLLSQVNGSVVQHHNQLLSVPVPLLPLLLMKLLLEFDEKEHEFSSTVHTIPQL